MPHIHLHEVLKSFVEQGSIGSIEYPLLEVKRLTWEILKLILVIWPSASRLDPYSIKIFWHVSVPEAAAPAQVVG